MCLQRPAPGGQIGGVGGQLGGQFGGQMGPLRGSSFSASQGNTHMAAAAAVGMQRSFSTSSPQQPQVSAYASGTINQQK